MNPKVVIKGVVVVCIGLAIGAFIGTSALSMYLYISLVESYSSCEGIELFYSGNGFEEDVLSAYEKYNKCYNSEPSRYSISWKFQSPEDLYYCKQNGYDCEDFAFMIHRCLAPKYSVLTRYYFSAALNDDSHVGVQLLKNGWEIIS